MEHSPSLGQTLQVDTDGSSQWKPSQAYQPIKGHAQPQEYLPGKAWSRMLTMITPDLGIMTPDCPHEKAEPRTWAPPHRSIVGSDPRSLMRPTTFQVWGPVSQAAPGGRDAVTRMAGLDGAQPFSGRLQARPGSPYSRQYRRLCNPDCSFKDENPRKPISLWTDKREENRHGAKHILTTPAKVSWKVDLQQLKVDEVLPQDKDCLQSFPYQLRVREANGTQRGNLGWTRVREWLGSLIVRLQMPQAHCSKSM
ncbi:hypothetical protein IWW34DRAFT_907656 [Fusarium oxysporum f. sp. albedinis]|nr:hypothetical protein IWW34DRAFT_907656 [Fusarium oxysporum f. sp. albedinis]